MLDPIFLILKTVLIWGARALIAACAVLTLYYHNTIIHEMGYSQAWQKLKAPIVHLFGYPNVTADAGLEDLAKSKPATSLYRRESIEDTIRKWSTYYHVHPDLAFAVAQVESDLLPYRTRFEPGYYKCHVLGIGSGCRKNTIPECWQGVTRDANGRKMMATSWGLYQVMPLTAAETASREGILDEIGDISGLLDVDLNTRIGLGYLRHCLDLHGGEFDHVAQCYNGVNTKGWGEAVKKALFKRILEQSLSGDLIK
jgi:hypothetical protein